jgi:hypothetical protein
MSSKIPIYVCFSIYVVICLLGNVITGIIWLKHHKLFGDNQEQQENVSLDNQTLLRLVWNETTNIDGSGFKVFDEETKGEDVLDSLEFLRNESTDYHQVSSY